MRFDVKVTENSRHIMRASLVPTSGEADHSIAEKISRASEPLAVVPLEEICATLLAAADANGLPPLFFLRLIWQESRFDQRAVSPAGALGVAQFMPDVAAERGLVYPFDPLAALWASAFFLRDHYRTFGNLGLAAMAYNAGARRVTDWLARRGKLPEETRKYVTIVTGQSPEMWTEPQSLDLALDLPRRAPCGEIAGPLERAAAKRIDVQLEAPIRKIIAAAKAEAAKAEAARKAKEAKEEAKEKAKAAKGNKTKEARAKDNNANKGEGKNVKTAAALTEAVGKKSVKNKQAVKSAHTPPGKTSTASARRKGQNKLAAN
jgi:soluble lytic murein transglycosylase-like protein